MSWWNIIKRQEIFERLVDGFEEDPTRTKLANIRKFLHNVDNEAYVDNEIFSKVDEGIKYLKSIPMTRNVKISQGKQYDLVYRLMRQRMKSNISGFEAMEMDFYHDKL